MTEVLVLISLVAFALPFVAIPGFKIAERRKDAAYMRAVKEVNDDALKAVE